jgi:hypothetical protein
MRPSPPARRFTLLDAIVLIAAVAVGIGWTKGGWERLHPQDDADIAYVNSYYTRLFMSPASPGTPPVAPSWWSPVTRAAEFVQVAAPTVASLSMAVLILRFRRPRHPMRTIVRQPGSAAMIAAAAGLIVLAIEFVVNAASEPVFRGRSIWPSHGVAYDSIAYLARATPRIAVAILAAWGLLGLGKIARPERGWLDRSGMVLGLVWIAMAIAQGWVELAGRLF